MKNITSLNNVEIKLVAQLAHKKHREEQQRFVAEGVRVCQTIINSGIKPIALYSDDATLVATLDTRLHVYVTLVTNAIMKKISQLTTPSGIIGVFPFATPPAPETLTAGIVLAGISDPGNMGTLIRTAAAMQIASVILIEGVDPYNPKVVQASAGTLAQVKIFQLTWQQLLQYKKTLRLCALVVTEGKPPAQIDFKSTLLIIGSEAHGIPTQWIQDCDEKMTIPMPGGTESLNAAVAGSIAMYCAKISLN